MSKHFVVTRGACCEDDDSFWESEDLHLDENKEGFKAHLERLEEGLETEENELTCRHENSKAVFLTVVGKNNQSLLMDLCVPSKPSEKKLIISSTQEIWEKMNV